MTKASALVLNTQPNPRPNQMIKQYPSIWAMREDWLKHNGPKNYTYGKGNDHWCGGETAAQTFAWSETGQQALVPQAEDLLAKLDTQISTKRRDIIHSPAGGWPDVPAYLAGRPLAMKRIADVQDERDRKSTRLNSSHHSISYAVFCLKKK